MKKTLFILLSILISGCTALADNIHFKEEVLDINSSFSPIQTRQTKRDADDEDEQKQFRMEQQAQDYMYRMQQQMMMPPAMNPYGGFSNYRY